MMIYVLINKIQLSDNSKKLLVMFLTPLTIYTLSTIWYFNLTTHRYYIVAYLMLTLLVFYHVDFLVHSALKKKLIYGCLFIGFITGHLWMYPDQIAKGWDATLAHIPYHHLRKEMIFFIQSRHIDPKSIGTISPNLRSLKYTNLSNEEWTFSEKDFNKNEYIFYSNIFNEFTDEEIEELKERWLLIKELRSGMVHVELYKNPRLTR